MLSTSAHQLKEVGTSIGLDGTNLLNFVRKQQKLKREKQALETERKKEKRSEKQLRKKNKKKERAFIQKKQKGKLNYF